MKKRYSGRKSIEFWRRVNALPRPSQAILYRLGCILQNMEEFVLDALKRAEADAK